METINSGGRGPCSSKSPEPARDAVSAWIKKSALNSEDLLFPSRIQESPHLSTRQYARIVDSWVQQKKKELTCSLWSVLTFIVTSATRSDRC